MSTTTEKKSRSFAPRDSTSKKETMKLVNEIKEGTTIKITQAGDDNTEEEYIGLSEVFFGLLNAPGQVMNFAKYASGDSMNRALFNAVFKPMLCTPFEHNKEATKLLSSFLWNKWFSKGNPESANIADTTFHRLNSSDHFEFLKDELKTLRSLATDLKDREYCKLQLCYTYSICEMLEQSEAIHYTFFDALQSLRGQLAETVSMNCSFNEVMDIKQEVAELFVRNQLMLFCKKNHHADASVPITTLDALVIPQFPTELRSQFFTKCKTMITDTHDKIHSSFDSFLVLRNAAKEKISHSDLKISKTTFRRWANRTLLTDGYHIRNSYDVVMCKVISYLGNDMSFSVRGNFQFPISIEGVEHEPEKPKQLKKKKITGNDPQKLSDGLVELLETMESDIETVRSIKRAFDNDPDIQQQLKRQRPSSSED